MNFFIQSYSSAQLSGYTHLNQTFSYTSVRTRKVSKTNKTSSFQVNGNWQRPSSHYIAISPSINVF